MKATICGKIVFALRVPFRVLRNKALLSGSDISRPAGSWCCCLPAHPVCALQMEVTVLDAQQRPRVTWHCGCRTRRLGACVGTRQSQGAAVPLWLSPGPGEQLPLPAGTWGEWRLSQGCPQGGPIPIGAFCSGSGWPAESSGQKPPALYPTWGGFVCMPTALWHFGASPDCGPTGSRV